MIDSESTRLQVTQLEGSGDNFQKALFKAQQEVVPEGILIVDLKGKILSRNNQFISMWNIPERIATSNDAEDILAYLKTLVHDPSIFADRFKPEKSGRDEISLKDNRFTERIWKPVIGEDNVVYGWIWAFRDISAHKIAEKALRDSESRYQNFISQSTEGIWRFELDKPIRTATPVASQIEHFFEYAYLAECNDAMAKMYGYAKAEELVGKRLSEFFPRNQETEQYLAHFIENKYRVDGAESMELDKNGNTIHFINNLVGIIENGFVVRAWGTQRDITTSVIAKQALMQSEARFRNILEQTPEPMIVLKGEDMVVDVANEPLLRTWRTDNRVIGKPLLECLPEVRGQGIMEMLLDVYHNRKVIKGYDHPVTYDRGNGVMETLYYNFVYTPYVDEKGEVTGVLIIGTDVTTSVLTRRKLEESEKRFRSIFETAGVSIWEEDFSAVGEAMENLKAQGVKDFRQYLKDHPSFVDQCLGLVRVTDVNLATLQMFEAESKEQLLGNLPAIFTRDTMHIFVNELVAIAENRTEYIAETRLNTVKGNPVFTMFHMKIPDSGRLDRVLFTLLDLTARKSAEEALKESELRFRSLIQEAPVATCLFVGPDFHIEIANEKMLQHMGKGKSVLGKPLAEALPELHDQPFLSILRHVYNSGESYSAHAVPATIEVNGHLQTSYFDYTFKPLRNDAGNVYAIIDMSVDVTAQVLSHQQLKESESKLKLLVAERTKELERINDELFRSNEDLQQFAHVASHDLKEPVRKITTFVDRLKTETESLIPASSRKYLEKIERAASRMMSMVEGVLNYSTIDSLNQTKERVDLTSVIANIEYDLELPIEKKNAKIIYQDLPTIEGAPVLIFQLFYNLINNSLKFKHPARDLIINISSSLIEEEGKTFAQIIVADNGIGFENEYADKIFDTFTRLHTKDQYEGTGLGLSLCKKIVQRHQGRIWAKGQPNVGAEFFIQLPVVQR
jgi:PAS domain S-box-containing protein